MYCARKVYRRRGGKALLIIVSPGERRVVNFKLRPSFPLRKEFKLMRKERSLKVND
jgi:hypothetical protein